MGKKVAKAGKDTLEHKSPAEFFAENKNIAGFDNVFYQLTACAPVSLAYCQRKRTGDLG